MSDVFISHSSKDAEIANKVCKFLEDKGLSCWIAPRNIVPGADWAASISTAITASKVFLIIYSANSAASTQVPREIGLAESKEGVYTIPYRVDDTPLTGSFEYYLTGAHWVNANYAKKDFKLDELYSVISGITGKNIQNITNNTYIDNLHIHNGEGVPQNLNEQITGAVSQVTQAQNKPAPAPAAPPAQPAEKKKLPLGLIAVIASGVVVLAIIIAIAVAASSKKDDDDTSSDNAAVTTASAVQTTKAVTSEAETNASNDTTEKKDITISVFNSAYKGNYSGDTNGNGQPDGEGKFSGKFTLDDSDDNTFEYVGSFKDGQITGKGTLTRCFVNGSNSKEIVEANWENGLIHGEGKETDLYTDGHQAVYEGNFEKRNWHGAGKLTTTYQTGNREKKIMEGNWSDDYNLDGDGTEIIYYTNGDKAIYEGEFKSSEWEGKGVKEYHYADGDIEHIWYEGVWNKSALNGTGVSKTYYKDGRISTYEGEYLSNKAHGKGKKTVEYKTGDYKRITYEGIWTEGSLSGKILMNTLKTDGTKIIYEGDYSNNKKNGIGKLTTEFTNGDKGVSEGTWIDDYFKGKGTQYYYWTNGSYSITEGEFDGINTVVSGTKTTYDKDGNVIETKNI